MDKTLIITDKKSVAENIRDALAGQNFESCGGYFESEKYLISWCAGHPVEPAPPESYREAWGTWSYESLPVIPGNWKYEVRPRTREQFEILQNMMTDQFPVHVADIINAADSSREGELIFRLVYDQAGCRKPVRRLWISSMEPSAIREGFANLKPEKDYDNLYRSALARQRADWLVGINGTRLYTVLYKGKTLKVGRVQTPTLSMIVDRENEIRDFERSSHYTLHLRWNPEEAAAPDMIRQAAPAKNSESENTETEKPAFLIDAVSEYSDMKTGLTAKEKACRLAGRFSVSSIEKTSQVVPPPTLYDLTGLQKDANKILGYTAKQTLEYARSLYEKKLITYPGTDSCYLTDGMKETAEKVRETVFRSGLMMWDEYAELDDKSEATLGTIRTDRLKNILDSSKVSDHHAIIPTVEIADQDMHLLPESERKLLGLIAVRLLEAVSSPKILNRIEAVFNCAGTEFRQKVSIPEEIGWTAYEHQYRERFTEKAADLINPFKDRQYSCLATLSEGQILTLGKYTEDIVITEHVTEPPKRFTEATLLAAMEHAGEDEQKENAEHKGLGTPATRSEIIEKLINDGYVNRGKRTLTPTEAGMHLISVLPGVLKSPQLTADWENSLGQIAAGQADADCFIDQIQEFVRAIIDFQTPDQIEEKELQMMQTSVLGTCPNCGAEVKSGRYGAFCTNKCGMQPGKFRGIKLTDDQVKGLLAGDKVYVKNLRGRSGNLFNAWLTMEGCTFSSYERNGKAYEGFEYKVKMDFNGDKSRKARNTLKVRKEVP